MLSSEASSKGWQEYEMGKSRLSREASKQGKARKGRKGPSG